MSDPMMTAALGGVGEATSSESARRALAGKEQFLQLLCAQISNQNPMNPMDDKDMVGQLAQFSAIEQAIETNTRLGAMEKGQNSASRLGMASLMGKEGAASTRRVVLEEGAAGPPPLSFSLDGRPEKVTVRVLDGEGNVKRTMEYGSLPPGPNTLAWDGRGADNKPLPPGSYRLSVKAQLAGGQEVAARTEVRGTIGRIDMEGNEPAVFLNDTRVPVSELTELAAK